MKLQKLNIVSENEVFFIQNLYTESFPLEERRPVDKMFKLYENNSSFKILLAIEENKRVGFFSYWDLNTFIFAEHFAISHDFRNRGYGSKVINLLLEKIYKPIVLEVEPADSKLAERRIHFYERLGFKLWEGIKYRRPSYYQDGKSYPMGLMCNGPIEIEKNRNEIINLIYTTAYEIDSKNKTLF